jgi:hypothetical protein
MEITKQKLQEIYYNNSNEKAAKMLKVSIPTLIKNVKMAGIPFKGHKNKKFKLRII